MKLTTIFWRPILYIYGFLFIFNPGSLLGINLVYLLSPISLIFLAPNFKSLYRYISNKRVFLFHIAMCMIILYLSIFYMYGSLDAYNRILSFILVILNTFCAFTLLMLYQKSFLKQYSIYNLINFIVSLGVLQVLFVLLALISPSFREWTLSNGDLIELSNDLGSGLRSYGLASGYTSTFPMFMGICSLLSILLLNETSKLGIKIYYLIVTLFFILSVILNARIGLAPVVIWLLLSPLYFLYRKKLLMLTFFSIFILVVFPYVFTKYNLLNSPLFFRLSQGIEEFTQLLSGNLTGTFEALYEMWFFPSNILSLLFGEGKNIVGASPKSSDIGLVQDIFMFGVIPTLFITVILIYFSYPFFKKLTAKFGLLVSFTLITSLILYYFKGTIFYANAVSNTMIFLSIAAFNRTKAIV